MEENSSISLLELNSYIKDALELNFVDEIWVVAEIADFRLAQKGHCYLELVEKQNNKIVAKNRANIWSFKYQHLSQKFYKSTGEFIQAGLKVLMRVVVKYHELYGISLTVNDIDPSYSLGELARKKQEILNRLEKEGLLHINKQLEIPLVIQKIAIISSPTAAGYEDFVNQLETNPYGFHFSHELIPSIMQGEETEKSIISALKRVNKRKSEFDVVVIIRGGGSKIDLAWFDNYEIAKSIAHSKLSIITGIGHERDESVADVVANTSAKTPTAVAEFIIEKNTDFLADVNDLEQILVLKSKNKLTDEKRFFETLSGDFINFSKLFLSESSANLDQISNNLSHLSKATLTRQKNLLSTAIRNIVEAPNHTLQLEEKKLSQHLIKLDLFAQQSIIKESNKVNLLEKSIELLDPKNVLKRGYSLTLKDGKIVQSKKGLKKGDIIQTQFNDGTIDSEIK